MNWNDYFNGLGPELSYDELKALESQFRKTHDDAVVEYIKQAFAASSFLSWWGEDDDDWVKDLTRRLADNERVPTK